MPVGVIDDVTDERHWDAAKARVREQYPDVDATSAQFWRLTMAIYKKMIQENRGDGMTKALLAPEIDAIYRRLTTGVGVAEKPALAKAKAPAPPAGRSVAGAVRSWIIRARDVLVGRPALVKANPVLDAPAWQWGGLASGYRGSDAKAGPPPSGGSPLCPAPPARRGIFLKAHVKAYQRTDPKTGKIVEVKDHTDRRPTAHPAAAGGTRPPRQQQPAAAPSQRPAARYLTIHTAGPDSGGHTVRMQPHDTAPGQWKIHPEDHRLAQSAFAPKQPAADTGAPQQQPQPQQQPAGASQQGSGNVLEKPSTAYRSVNPEGLDTEALFKQGDAYTPERQELHKAIIAKLAAGAPRSKQPTFYMTGGGGASGKGNVLKAGLLGLPEQCCHIDADEIKKDIPDYREMAQKKDAKAAAFAHEESAHVSGLAIAHAASNGLDAVYDSVGDSGIEKLSKKVATMRASGHRIVAHYVTVDTEEAIRRAKARGDKTGRYVPEVVLRGAHAAVSRILPEAIAKGLFDECTLWDTNEGTPRKVVSAKGTQLAIHDKSLWERFTAKAGDDKAAEQKAPQAPTQPQPRAQPQPQPGQGAAPR